MRPGKGHFASVLLVVLGAVPALAAFPASAIEPADAIEDRDTTRSDPVDQTAAAGDRTPLFDLRPGSSWLGLLQGGQAFGPDAPPSLFVDIHPLHNGFRLSLSPALERPSLALPDLSGAAGAAAPGTVLDPAWYLGFGWTGSLGGRMSLFVDIGAAYIDGGLDVDAGTGLPPMIFSLRDQTGGADRPADDSLSRLLPMLSVSFAYRF